MGINNYVFLLRDPLVLKRLFIDDNLYLTIINFNRLLMDESPLLRESDNPLWTCKLSEVFLALFFAVFLALILRSTKEL